MEKFGSFFSWILLKLHFEWKIWANSKMNTIRAFFTKWGNFFLIFKTGQRRPPPLPLALSLPPDSCAPVLLAESLITYKLLSIGRQSPILFLFCTIALCCNHRFRQLAPCGWKHDVWLYWTATITIRLQHPATNIHRTSVFYQVISIFFWLAS